VAIENAQLTGRLRGYPVVARGAVQLAGSDAWSFAPLMLESGASRIELEGAIDSERITVAVDAVVEYIGLLAPGVRGSLDGEATLAGTWSEPRARGDFVARGVAFEGITAERVDVRGEIGTAAAAQLELLVEAEN